MRKQRRRPAVQLQAECTFLPGVTAHVAMFEFLIKSSNQEETGLLATRLSHTSYSYHFAICISFLEPMHGVISVMVHTLYYIHCYSKKMQHQSVTFQFSWGLTVYIALGQNPLCIVSRGKYPLAIFCSEKFKRKKKEQTQKFTLSFDAASKTCRKGKKGKYFLSIGAGNQSNLV